MSTDLAFLRHKDLNRVAPLIKNLEAWNAFMVLLDHEEAKLMLELLRKPIAEDLYRLSGRMELINNLRKAKERLLAIEQEPK